MIYLDNAATSKFKPRVMFDAMFAQLSNSSNSGRGGHNDSIDTAIKIFEARNTIKEFINCPSEYEIIWTANCTEALNLAILGYLQQFHQEKINVITTVNEHNSTLRPLFHLRNSQNIDIKVIPAELDGSISPAKISDAIDKDTKLICVNHISNVTGGMTDIGQIGKIARMKGVPLLVDCAQSLGHCTVDIRAENIDFLACAGHKGLHGSQGVGFLVYNTKHSLTPLKFGGTGTHSDSLTQPNDPPEAFESGTLNAPAIIGLGASVDWTAKNFDSINLNIRYLTSELIYGLKSIKGITLYTSQNHGVVSFNYKDYLSSDLGDICNENNIAVRCGLHCAPLIHKHLGTLERGTVRASIGYNNNISDINSLLNLIKNI